MSGTCTIAGNRHGQRRIRRERDVRNGQSDISGDWKGCCDAARNRDRDRPWSWSGRSVHSVGSRRRTGYHGEIRRVGSYISRNTRGWSHKHRLKGPKNQGSFDTELPTARTAACGVEGTSRKYFRTGCDLVGRMHPERKMCGTSLAVTVVACRKQIPWNFLFSSTCCAQP